MNKTIKQRLEKWFLLHIPLIVLVLFVTMPMAWVLITSLKTDADFISGKLRYIPEAVTFHNFSYVWLRGNFSLYFKNSLMVAAFSVVIVLALAIANGYALSRFNFKGKSLFMILLLATQFIPVIMILVPRFLFFKNVGMIDTPYALIVSMVAANIPFQTLLMRGFIGGVPVEIDEAAMIDGASRTRILLTVIPRVVLPGIAVTVSMVFINSWNEFISAFTFISSQENFTISVGLRYLIGEYSVEYAALSAAGIIALLPPLFLFAYVQKFLVSGLNVGAVKG